LLSDFITANVVERRSAPELPDAVKLTKELLTALSDYKDAELAESIKDIAGVLVSSG